jgi:hypothetical protein
VWNHASGHTQHLGRALIRSIRTRKGDLDGFIAAAIDRCPEGWSEFDKKRCEDPVGFLEGTFDGVVATCDAGANPLCFDASYLYLFAVPKRRLYVFAVKDGPMRPFGMVTFDAAGIAKPRSLPAVDE